MTLRELLDWVTVQGKVDLFLFEDNGDIEIDKYYDDFESEYCSDFLEEYYVKYMYSVDNRLKIELSREKY